MAQSKSMTTIMDFDCYSGERGSIPTHGDSLAQVNEPSPGSTLVCPQYSNVQGLPNRLKYAIRCGRVCMAKLLNSIEYLASEVFSCASLNSPNIFSLTHNTIYSPFT